MIHFVDILNRLDQNIDMEVDDKKIKKSMKKDLADLHYILQAVPKKLMKQIHADVTAIDEGADA